LAAAPSRTLVRHGLPSSSLRGSAGHAAAIQRRSLFLTMTAPVRVDHSVWMAPGWPSQYYCLSPHGVQNTFWMVRNARRMLLPSYQAAYKCVNGASHVSLAAKG